MGALLGGLYAAGYDGRALERLVTTLDVSALIFGSSAPGGLSLAEAALPGPTLVEVPMRGLSLSLPEGLLTGQPLLELLAELLWDVHGVTDFRELPRPFACNAVDLVTGEGVMIDRGYLPLAIRTCMSLPGAFRPIHYEGGIYLDGGPDHMLPVPEAEHLGADLVIGVDVSGDVDPETGEVPPDAGRQRRQPHRALREVHRGAAAPAGRGAPRGHGAPRRARRVDAELRPAWATPARGSRRAGGRRGRCCPRSARSSPSTA